MKFSKTTCRHKPNETGNRILLFVYQYIKKRENITKVLTELI